MRRIVAVLGVLMLLLGVKLYEVEPADCGYAGERTAFEESIRYDFNGDYDCAVEAIEKLGGKILWSEELDCGAVCVQSANIQKRKTFGRESEYYDGSKRRARKRWKPYA